MGQPSVGLGVIAAFRAWREAGPVRRLRRELRKDAFVYCEGDTASHWSGFDFDYCRLEGCTQPNGGRCLAALQTEVRYKIRCAANGIEP